MSFQPISLAADKNSVLKIFTGRNDLLDAFRSNYKKELDGTIHVMTFCGTGGVGKTTLLKKIEDEIKHGDAYRREKCRYVTFDFENKNDRRDFFDAFRTQLSAYGCEFPMFDTGNYCYSLKIGRNIPPPQMRSELEKIPFVAQSQKYLSQVERRLSNPIVSTLMKSFSATAGVAYQTSTTIRIAKELFKLVDTLWTDYKKFKKVWDDEHSKVQEQFELLRDEKNPDELFEFLPTLLALDVKDWMKTTFNKDTDKKLVVFLDTYESLTGATILQTAEQRKRDSWLSGDSGLIAMIPDTLWVIAGRNLSWSGDFAKVVEPHAIEALNSEDAANFLKRAGVGNENLRAELVKLTQGYPIFLNLCAKFYADYKRQKPDEEPTIDEFGHKREAVVERIFKYLDDHCEDAAKDLLEVFCVLKVWTDEIAMDICAKVLGTLSHNTYRRVKKFSIIKSETVSNRKADTRFTLYSFDKTIQSIWIDQIAAEYPDLIAEVKKAVDERFEKFFAGRRNFDTREIIYLKLWAEFIVRFADDAQELRKQCAQRLSKQINILTNCAADFDALEEILPLFMNKIETLTGTTDNAPYAYFERRLSTLREKQGRYEEACERAKSSYEKRARHLGESHPATLSSMNTLANSLDRLDRYEEALPYRKKVLTLRTQKLPENDVKVLDAMSNYAATLSKLKFFYEALNRQVKVFLAYKEMFGEKSKKTLNALGNLASTLRSIGHYGEALDYRKKVYLAYKAMFGESDPDDIVRAMNNFAISLSDFGRHDEARTLQEEILTLRTETLGEKNSKTINAMSALAFTLSNLNCYDEVLELQRRILRLCEETFKSDPRKILAAMQNLSATQKYLGNFGDALPLEKEILALCQKNFGEKNPETINSMIVLAKTHKLLGRREDALPLVEKALALQTETFGEENPATKKILELREKILQG